MIVGLMALLNANQLYGSTSSILCDPSNQTSCNDQRVSNSDTEVTDNLRTDNTETPIIIPNISLTDQDLGDTTSGSSNRIDTDVPRDNDNIDKDSENSIDRNPDDNEETNIDDESDDKGDDSESLLIPFP
jgi:hypothetical protein